MFPLTEVIQFSQFQNLIGPQIFEEMSHPCSLERPELLKSGSGFEIFPELGRFKFMERNGGVNLQGIKNRECKVSSCNLQF